MKNLRLVSLFAFLCLCNAAANASGLNLTCEGTQTFETCAAKIQNVLAKAGCNIDAEKSECGHFVNSDSVYCRVSSDNCSKPIQGLFGGDSCYSDSEEVTLSKSDGIHNGYYYGFLGSYSRNICILK